MLSGLKRQLLGKNSGHHITVFQVHETQVSHYIHKTVCWSTVHEQIVSRMQSLAGMTWQCPVGIGSVSALNELNCGAFHGVS